MIELPSVSQTQAGRSRLKSRVGQHVDIGIDTERSATTRRKDSPKEPVVERLERGRDHGCRVGQRDSTSHLRALLDPAHAVQHRPDCGSGNTAAGSVSGGQGGAGENHNGRGGPDSPYHSPKKRATKK